MDNRHLFSEIIIEYWKKQFKGEILIESKDFILFVNENLDVDYQVMTLEFPSQINWIAVRPELLQFIEIEDLRGLNFEEVVKYLNDKRLFFHGADYIFYFSDEEKQGLK